MRSRAQSNKLPGVAYSIRYLRAPGLVRGARRMFTDHAAAHLRRERDMGHYLLIVPRDRQDLYEYLKRQFVAVDNFEVILDQREGERRQRSEPREPERRRAQRRRPPDSYRRTDWFVIARQETN